MGPGGDDPHALRTGAYDPFDRGRFPVGVRTIHALDRVRGRRFPCELWYPAAGPHADQDAARDAEALDGLYPLVVLSHHSAGNRRSATFLATHLSSHGYIVAAMDHSDVVAPELRRSDSESDQQRATRVQGWIANRVPDIRFLLDHLLGDTPRALDATPDPGRIGIVGHSFGGWTALAAPSADRRLRSVVALAPGGSSKRRPGIIPATLAFDWDRPVPTLYLVAELDTALPLDGMHELYGRTPPPRQMVMLRRADHLHFVDDVEREHEAMRAIPATGELAWIKEMPPISELCSAEQAHLFVRALTLAHMDATLRDKEQARRFLRGDIPTELAARGIDAASSTLATDALGG